MRYIKDPHRIQIFHEGSKRRIRVAMLEYDPDTKRYSLTYVMKYLRSNTAIPLGPDLNFIRQKHVSEPDKLFPTFIDRIPDRQNPAYGDYCRSQGI